jgi:uncharacterized RDD family membrane protein YckC
MGMNQPGPAGPVAGTTIADFQTRLVAWVIDGAIIGAIAWVLDAVLYRSLILSLLELYPIVIGLITAAVSAGYFIYFWTTRKQTPGMMAMKLMVVDSGSGAALSQPVAIRRWLFLGLPLALSTMVYVGGGFGIGLVGLFVVWTLIAVASIAWEIYLAYMTNQDPRKQGPHDKAANSVVISVGPSPLAGMGQRR